MKQFVRVLLVIAAVCGSLIAQTKSAPVATDVYHVHFTKAALGRAADLGKSVSTPDPKAPMPGHFIVLRHQEGDDWDYCVIEHLGTKATVDASTSATPADVRDQSAWHGDTFVSGPSWAEFSKQLGIDQAEKSGRPVYIVSVQRAAAGHRDQLEQLLRTPSNSKVPTGNVVMQHLEGGPWNFLAITRYNSWADLAADRSAPGNPDAWNQNREHTAMHHDTIADRIAPK